MTAVGTMCGTRVGTRCGTRVGDAGYPTAYGVSGWTGSNILRVPTTGAGLVGASNTPLWRETVLRIDSQAVASATRVISWYFTGGTGWRVYTSGANAALVFDILDSGVAFRAATTLTLTSGMVGKLIHYYAYWDGATVKACANGVSTGGGTACTTYLAPLTTSNHTIGARSTGTLPADGVTILGIRGGDGVKSDADAATAYSAFRATSRLSASGADKCWDFATSWASGLTVSAAELVGGVAGDRMEFSAGNTSGHTLQTIVSPEYA